MTSKNKALPSYDAGHSVKVNYKFGAALPASSSGAYVMLCGSTARGKLINMKAMRNLALLVQLR